MSKLLVFILILGLALSVAACGRKGQPEPPPGSDYPRTYPSR
jgi:predicted small lipoprotein YifL